MLRHAVAPVFMHTYTRVSLTPVSDNPGTPSTDESTDAWGLPVETSAVDVTGLECLYQEKGILQIQAAGPISVNVPVLLVPFDDPLTEGDHVKNIATKPSIANGYQSVVLIVGPVRVEVETLIGPEYGGALYKECQLRNIQVIQ